MIALLKSLPARIRQTDLLRDILDTFVTRVSVSAMGVVITILVARALGPDGRGLFAVAMSVAALGVQLGNLGLSAANTFFLARSSKILPFVLGNSLLVSVSLGGGLSFVLWLIFRSWPHLAPIHDWLLILALVWIPLGIVFLLLQNIHLGLQNIRLYNRLELYRQSLTLLALISAVLLGMESPEHFFAISLAVLLAVVLASTLSILSREGTSPKPSLSLLKRHARYGLKAYLAAFFSFLVLKIDLLMIQYILGAEPTGQYSIAVAVSDILYMLPVVVGTVLFPKLAGMQNERAKWILVRRFAQWVAVGLFLAAALVAVLARPLIELIFGIEYLPSASAVVLLMPAVVVLGVNTIFMNYFASLGMPLFTVYSPAAATVANIPANLFLIPVFGIEGAAVASVISYAMMLGASLWYCTRLVSRFAAESAGTH